MLTDRRIEAARKEELERLKARIEAELAGRDRQEEEEEEEEEEERLSRSERGVVEGGGAGSGGTYRWEMVECGHKERCHKCKSGEKHGPYLYRYLYKGGRYSSEYVKLAEARELGFVRPPAPGKA